jgi:serine/threonine protein kinase
MASRDRTEFGKYRVLARLGRGGMGDVYLAVNMGPSGVSKLIVVKELREQFVSVPEARSMFLDEARIATRLNHPNVVQTYEVVEEPDSLYITMEYLEGQPLQNIIRGPKRALVPVVLQLQILADTLAALHYAHELTDYDGTPLAVVHRDVSPHNVFVTYEGVAKLVDFGIAKAANAKTVTETGVFKGKVRFSSPEQALGTEVDRRSDVFAAGAVLWEIVTGEAMWKGMPDTKVLLAIASGNIPTPRSVNPDVPEALDAICLKALAFAPEDRYATASEFRDALLVYLRELSDPGVALGSVMTSAFAKERSEMRAIIDAEVCAIRDASSESIRRRRVPVLSVPPPPGTSVHAGLAHTRMLKPPPSGGRVITLALIVCGVLAALIYGSFPRPAARSVGSLTAPVAAASLALSAAPARTVHVRLSAQPSSARFTVDGAPVPSNPYEADVPSDGVVHQIAAQAGGYEPRELPATFDRDVFLDVTLAPSTPLVASAASAASRPKHLLGPAMVPPAPVVPPSRPLRPIEEEDPYKK